MEAMSDKNTFDSHRPTPEQVVLIEEVRSLYKGLYECLLHLPSNRERSIAITNLEQSCMWAVKGVIHSE